MPDDVSGRKRSREEGGTLNAHQVLFHRQLIPQDIVLPFTSGRAHMSTDELATARAHVSSVQATHTWGQMPIV